MYQQLHEGYLVELGVGGLVAYGLRFELQLPVVALLLKRRDRKIAKH
jgi:hypothetical protein